MRKFTTLAEFDAHIESTPYPRLLVASARERMRAVEQCNEGGANAVLIFTDNPDEAVAVGAEYHLGQSFPGVHHRERPPSRWPFPMLTPRPPSLPLFATSGTGISKKTAPRIDKRSGQG